jgi:hypothetical protein
MDLLLFLQFGANKTVCVALPEAAEKPQAGRSRPN